MKKESVPFSINLIFTTIIIIALIKATLVVTANPIMGYANNWDFTRQSSCNGLWLMTPEGNRSDGNSDAVYNNLIFDGLKQKEICIRSSDNLFSKIATKFYQKGQEIDFRIIGSIKLAFTLLCLIALFPTIQSTAIKSIIAIFLSLVISDFANLLYLNTLYNEYSVIISIALCISLITSLASNQEQKKEKQKIFLLIFFASWLGLSKHQYMPLAVLFAVLSGIIFLKKNKSKKALILFATAICIPLCYNILNKPHKGIIQGNKMANNTNTLFFTVLPASPDPAEALKILRLPEACASSSGLSWYAPELDHQNHPCPEVESFSRIRLFSLFPLQPSTLTTPLKNGLYSLPPFYPAYLSHLEQPRDPESKNYKILWQTSFSHWLNKLLKLENNQNTKSLLFYAIIFMISPFIILNSILRKNTPMSAPLLITGLGGGVMLYSIFSSIFGDGYIEVIRHSSGFLVGFAAFLTGIASLFFILSTKLFFARKKL